MRRLEAQRKEMEAVLSSMVEGVVAVDHDLSILSMNRAASRMFGHEPSEIIGRPIAGVAGLGDTADLLSAAMGQDDPVEGELPFGVEGLGLAQAHATRLRAPSGETIGALVVLHDVTRLRTLERVRQDFVASVSHELKTPVTTIKGFIETLLDGAVEDPEEAERFLRIAARQVDRLNAIIEDLLTLSRLEQASEKTEILMESILLEDVLRTAVEVCEPRASEKGVTISLDCPDGLRVEASPALLEQAVINLVDNAVKYSDPGNSVQVGAERGAEGLVVWVRDHGSGIPAEHLPRLFERFYRVDKARSRTAGGTGLGLAIVKHIAQVHGGEARVESAAGAGSTFSLVLPR